MRKAISSPVWLTLTLAYIAMTVTLACQQEQSPTEPGNGQTITPTFSSIQDNIFTPKCVNAGCHNPTPGPMSLQKGVAYENLVNKPSAWGMPRVEPGNADNSALYLKLIGDARVGGPQARMPLGAPQLPQEEINAVKEWINAGAKNN